MALFFMERGVRDEGALGTYQPARLTIEAEDETHAANLFTFRARTMGLECAHGWRLLPFDTTGTVEPGEG